MLTAEVRSVPLGNFFIEGLRFPNGTYGIAVPQIAAMQFFRPDVVERDIKVILGQEKEFSFKRVNTSFYPTTVKAITLKEFEILSIAIALKGNTAATDLTHHLREFFYHVIKTGLREKGVKVTAETVREEFESLTSAIAKRCCKQIADSEALLQADRSSLGLSLALLFDDAFCDRTSQESESRQLWFKELQEKEENSFWFLVPEIQSWFEENGSRYPKTQQHGRLQDDEPFSFWKDTQRPKK